MTRNIIDYYTDVSHCYDLYVMCECTFFFFLVDSVKHISAKPESFVTCHIKTSSEPQNIENELVSGV